MSPLRVAFQGERGAYSEQAALALFGADIEPVPCQSFDLVFEQVESGECDHGAVPIENSLAGSIHRNLDLLLQHDLYIVAEHNLRVSHCLIAAPGVAESDITRVYSHPQALAQCDEYLRRHEGWELVPFYDTAGSVAHIAEAGLPENAAIASAQAAQVYGMEIIKEGIETNPQNYTRFVVLSREDERLDARPNLASLVFSTPDRPGALFGAMSIMADASLNLKKLESRPIAGKPWQYMFYVDVEMPESDEAFQAALERLDALVEDLRVLGIYRGQ